jgi:putative phosphotransacetylase
VISVDKDQLVKLITAAVKDKLKENKKLYVPVGVSARHVHLTKEHVELLFGKGHQLTKKKELMGGQFAAEECITLIGSKLTAIEKVRVLGPVRSQSQVELAKTDAIKLGINAPVRDSGNLEGSAAITLVGPKGSITLQEGCIIAKRHIHMSPSEALSFGVKDKEMVSVKIPGDRGGVLSNVLVRVHESYTLEMHIDTDEANALEIKCGSNLEIVFE